MRPRKYFAVFREGKVIRITHGHQQARQDSPHRAWWNYDHRHWFEKPSTKE